MLASPWRRPFVPVALLVEVVKLGFFIALDVWDVLQELLKHA